MSVYKYQTLVFQMELLFAIFSSQIQIARQFKMETSIYSYLMEKQKYMFQKKVYILMKIKDFQFRKKLI